MKLLVGLFLILFSSSNIQAAPGCEGRFVNPISDISWKCIFPISIFGYELPIFIDKLNRPNSKVPTDPICLCNSKILAGLPIPGIPIGFWEPARLIEVTKSPFCLVSLGGISLGTLPGKGYKEDDSGEAFYHVHWYIYPLIYWLEILTDFLCLDSAAIDIAYLTEFDPMWTDDALSNILNPETLLFGNPLAQLACVADCALTVTGLANDLLFWCSGCQGGIYPFSGTTSSHNGAVGTAQLIATKFIAKGHRELLLWGYTGKKMLLGVCNKYFQPIIPKHQYRLQLLFPRPVFTCNRIGQSEVLLQAGREFPIKGEDFAFLVWRKRDCCLSAP
jgi:conjugal transfer pilus assembly protein TraU